MISVLKNEIRARYKKIGMNIFLLLIPLFVFALLVWGNNIFNIWYKGANSPFDFQYLTRFSASSLFYVVAIYIIPFFYLSTTIYTSFSKKRGSNILLFSHPLKPSQIVLGKFIYIFMEILVLNILIFFSLAFVYGFFTTFLFILGNMLIMLIFVALLPLMGATINMLLNQLITILFAFYFLIMVFLIPSMSSYSALDQVSPSTSVSMSRNKIDYNLVNPYFGRVDTYGSYLPGVKSSLNTISLINMFDIDSLVHGNISGLSYEDKYSFMNSTSYYNRLSASKDKDWYYKTRFDDSKTESEDNSFYTTKLDLLGVGDTPYTALTPFPRGYWTSFNFPYYDFKSSLYKYETESFNISENKLQNYLIGINKFGKENMGKIVDETWNVLYDYKIEKSLNRGYTLESIFNAMEKITLRKYEQIYGASKDFLNVEFNYAMQSFLYYFIFDNFNKLIEDYYDDSDIALSLDVVTYTKWKLPFDYGISSILTQNTFNSSEMDQIERKVFGSDSKINNLIIRSESIKLEVKKASIVKPLLVILIIISLGIGSFFLQKKLIYN